MKSNQPNTLDMIIQNFETGSTCDAMIDQRQAITIWVPASYKAKFDDLQNQTKKRFGKALRSVLIQSIDRVAEKKA